MISSINFDRRKLKLLRKLKRDGNYLSFSERKIIGLKQRRKLFIQF